MTSSLPQGPYGFKPIRHQNGGLIRAQPYTIATNYATNIFAGDLVATSGTGRNIIVGVSGSAVRGVFMGCQFVDSFGNARFEKMWLANLPVNTNVPVVALVYDDPLIVYKAQTSGSIANTNLNAYYGFAGQASGSTLTGMSAESVTAGSHSASSSTLFALNLTAVPGNDFGGFSELEVLIAKHELNPGFTATGS